MQPVKLNRAQREQLERFEDVLMTGNATTQSEMLEALRQGFLAQNELRSIRRRFAKMEPTYPDCSREEVYYASTMQELLAPREWDKQQHTPTSVLLSRRHRLCAELHRAGARFDKGQVQKLQGLIQNTDSRLPVPDFPISKDVPKVGDYIYLPTRFSIDHGWDDVDGGVGVVKKVEEGISGGEPCYFIHTHEHPSHAHNWEFLDQSDLKESYRGQWARPCPDLG